MEPTAYKRMLIDISKTISDDEFAALKFLLDQKISKRRMEEMTTILKLFTELENRDELSSSNLVFLRYILNEISEGRKHLTGIIDRATGQSTNGRLPVPADRPQDDNQVNQIDLHREMQYLSKSLGRQWRQMCRNLPQITEADIDGAKEQFQGNLTEQALHVLKLWQKRNGPKSTRQELIRACRKAEMNLFADELEDPNFEQ